MMSATPPPPPETLSREQMIETLQRVKQYTAEARENPMRIGMRWSLEDAEREVDDVLAALRAAPPQAERIRELRAELESAVDRESALVLERQHAMTTAQHYAHLVALVREWQASFNEEWERAPSGDFEHPANVRHAKAENDLFAWTPPAAPPVPEGDGMVRMTKLRGTAETIAGTPRLPGEPSPWDARFPEAAPHERPAQDEDTDATP